MFESRVNLANNILSDFLVAQRESAQLSIELIADLVGKTPDQMRSIEALPIKTPLYQIAKLVKIYKTDPFALQEKLHLISATIQKH